MKSSVDILIVRRAAKRQFPICALLSLILLAQQANAFWFICKYREAVRTATVADKARARYHEYLNNPRASRAQVEACQQAWDLLRNATLDQIKEFAQEVPGTSLTGPANVRELTKQAVKEAIKEALGEVSSLYREGMPLPLSDGQSGEFARAPGAMVAAQAFASVPVGDLADENITALTLAYVSPLDYDGGLGEAPPWSMEVGPLLLIAGSFRDVTMGSFQIGASNPLSAAHAGSTFTPEDLYVGWLENPKWLQGAYDNGFFSRELLEWVMEQGFGWDPESQIHPAMHQTGFLEITAVDVAAGTVAGNFFSIAGVGPTWDNGTFDFQIATASEVGANGKEVRAADDFELPAGNGLPWDLKSITAQLVQTSDPLSNRAQLEIYRDSGAGAPENSPPLAVFTSADSQAIVTHSAGEPVREYVFDTAGLTLSPGRYWLAAIGLGDGLGRASFASANHPDIRLGSGHVLRPDEGFAEWTPVVEVDGIATDFAFTVDAEQPPLVSPVPLRIEVIGGGLARLSWPAVGSSFYALQQAANVSGPWQQSHLPVLEEDGHRTVLVPVSEGQNLLRLGTQSRKGHCEGDYRCAIGGGVYQAGAQTRIGFWDVPTCPRSATLGDGSQWDHVLGTCRCP